MKYQTVTHEFVDYVPDDLKPGEKLDGIRKSLVHFRQFRPLLGPADARVAAGELLFDADRGDRHGELSLTYVRWAHTTQQ